MRDSRARHDHRNTHGRLIDENGVGEFAMLTETFTVIRQEDQDSVLIATRLAKRVHDPAYLRIGKCDLAVIRPAGEPLAVRRRRIVGRVRVVEVHPREKRRLIVVVSGFGPFFVVSGFSRTQPSDEGIRDLVGAPLRSLLARVALVKLLVEGVETLAETERSGHRVCADKRRRTIAAPLQQGRQRQVVLTETEYHVVAHAVHRWVKARQDRRVRRSGERRRGLHLFEPDAFRRKRVKRWRRARGRAVHTNVIGTERVDRDEQQVWMSRASPPAEHPPGQQRGRNDSGPCREQAPTHSPRRQRGRS